MKLCEVCFTNHYDYKTVSSICDSCKDLVDIDSGPFISTVLLCLAKEGHSIEDMQKVAKGHVATGRNLFVFTLRHVGGLSSAAISSALKNSIGIDYIPATVRAAYGNTYEYLENDSVYRFKMEKFVSDVIRSYFSGGGALSNLERYMSSIISGHLASSKVLRLPKEEIERITKQIVKELKTKAPILSSLNKNEEHTV